MPYLGSDDEHESLIPQIGTSSPQPALKLKKKTAAPAASIVRSADIAEQVERQYSQIRSQTNSNPYTRNGGGESQSRGMTGASGGVGGGRGGGAGASITGFAARSKQSAGAKSKTGSGFTINKNGASSKQPGAKPVRTMQRFRESQGGFS